eukprot:3533382-Lingulodinium_polyedra.AAC.1
MKPSRSAPIPKPRKRLFFGPVCLTNRTNPRLIDRQSSIPAMASKSRSASGVRSTIQRSGPNARSLRTSVLRTFFNRDESRWWKEEPWPRLN